MECAEESAILRRIQAEAIEDTGGYFVQFAGDDPDYADRWVESARAIGLPFEEIDVAELLRREPRVNPSAQRAMHVADGSVDGDDAPGEIATCLLYTSPSPRDS